MNCQECELLLGLDEPSSEVDLHLDACPACRALAADLRANAEVFEVLASDPMPPVRHRVLARVAERKTRSQVLRWGWALAAAAMLVLAIIAPRFRQQKLPPAHFALAPMNAYNPPIAPTPRVRKHPRATQPLTIKMLTPDPNVVIYWQIDAEGENQ